MQNNVLNWFAATSTRLVQFTTILPRFLGFFEVLGAGGRPSCRVASAELPSRLRARIWRILDGISLVLGGFYSFWEDFQESRRIFEISGRISEVFGRISACRLARSLLISLDFLDFSQIFELRKVAPKKDAFRFSWEPNRKCIFWSKGKIALSFELHWGLFEKIYNSISQKTTLFQQSEANLEKKMGVNGMCICRQSASVKTFFF